MCPAVFFFHLGEDLQRTGYAMERKLSIQLNLRQVSITWRVEFRDLLDRKACRREFGYAEDAVSAHIGIDQLLLRRRFLRFFKPDKFSCLWSIGGKRRHVEQKQASVARRVQIDSALFYLSLNSVFVPDSSLTD